MNEIGPFVKKGIKSIEKTTTIERLVIICDDLEAKIGKIKVRKGVSAKGHNGIKSIELAGIKEYTKISIGIGRPESRDPNVVAGYVLQSIDDAEMELYKKAFDDVFEVLLKS